MNRYLIKDKDHEFKLYYPSIEAAQKAYPNAELIQPYNDNSHMEYINFIKQHCIFRTSFKSSNSSHKEIYKSPYYKGEILIMLSYDPEDNTYYDVAWYMEYKNHSFTYPIAWNVSDPKEVYDILSISTPQYKILSRRTYGQPKLAKPKELKGISPIGKVTYIPKHCNPQVFIKDNDVYIKHTDYFSYLWIPPTGERIGMPLKYYLEKYFDTTRKAEFIYPDGYGLIVLRNEAWICLKNYVHYIKTDNPVLVAQSIVNQQKNDIYTQDLLNNISTQINWSHFWENVCNLVKTKLNVCNTEKENN